MIPPEIRIEDRVCFGPCETCQVKDDTSGKLQFRTILDNAVAWKSIVLCLRCRRETVSVLVANDGSDLRLP